MGVSSGPLKSSANSGEFGQDLKGKLTIKQYYSAGLRFKNIEPVPQSGFRLMPGSAYLADCAGPAVRYAQLNVGGGLSYVLACTPGSIAIFRNDRVQVATIALETLTLENLEKISFYGEANTVGIFEPDQETIRLRRNKTDDTDWTVDDWPYGELPKVDLGGSYTKTTDRWTIYLRWSGTPALISLALSVDGRNAAAVNLASPASADGAAWAAFAAALEDEIQGLSGLSEATVTYPSQTAAAGSRLLSVSFGGSLEGDEYQLDARVVNTSEASALTSHAVIGRTEGEALVSETQGWFAGMDVFSDRAIYFGPQARPAALAMSAPGEYFDLDIEKTGPSAPILTAIRTETSQRILHVYDAKYLLVFTDEEIYFVSNRTINRDEPINLVFVSDDGGRAGVLPVDLDGQVYFVGKNGDIVYSAAYDDISTSFTSNPESFLASHLVSGVKRTLLQTAVDKNNAARLWLLRGDGRLVCAFVIRSQEITAFVEWVPALGGLVRDITRFGDNQVMVAVDRNGVVTHEILEEQELNLFQRAVRLTTDLTGRVSGLSAFNGMQVWARINGYVLGPFTVADGYIDTDEPSSAALIGIWQPPVFESMPYIKVLPDETVIRRPGRVFSVQAYVLDTESIAIGANGSPAKNVPLARTTDDLTVAPVPYTGEVDVAGLNGATIEPTVVITQTRPGMLRLRDYIPGVKS